MRNIDTIVCMLAAGIAAWWMGYGPLPILTAQTFVAVGGIAIGAWLRAAKSAWRS